MIQVKTAWKACMFDECITDINYIWVSMFQILRIFILGFQILRQSLSFLSQISTFNIHVKGRIVWLIFFCHFLVNFRLLPLWIDYFHIKHFLMKSQFSSYFLRFNEDTHFSPYLWIKVQWLTVFKNKGTIWK